LEEAAAAGKLDPHEQSVYDNARRVLDRNAPGQTGERDGSPPQGSRDKGNPDHLALSGDEDALVPVTPGGEDAHLDAAADTPPAPVPAPVPAVGTRADGPDTPANPDAPTASQLPNGQKTPSANAASNTPPPKLTAKSVNSGQSKGKPTPPPGKPPAGSPTPVSSGKPKPVTPPIYNKTHKNSQPIPKGTGVNGGRMQSHHGIQKKWAIHNLTKYGYDHDLAPTITIETGTDLQHTIITNLQHDRRDARTASGKGTWSSTLQEELGHITSDLTAAGFNRRHILKVLEQQYSILDKLNVPYKRIKY
jgi:hypothetical protein